MAAPIYRGGPVAWPFPPAPSLPPPPPPPKEPAMTLEQILVRLEEAVRENTQAQIDVRNEMRTRLPLPTSGPMTATEVQARNLRAWHPNEAAIASVRSLVHTGISREQINAIEAVCTWAERSP